MIHLHGAPPFGRRRRSKCKTQAKPGHSNGKTDAKQKESGGKAWHSKGIAKVKLPSWGHFGAILAYLGPFWGHIQDAPSLAAFAQSGPEHTRGAKMTHRKT